MFCFPIGRIWPLLTSLEAMDRDKIVQDMMVWA
jgi:hypothetical protein